MDVSSIGFFIKPTTYADWANRTLTVTVTGNTSSYCNPLPMYMTISSDGSQFSSTCKLGTPAYASGTITQFDAMPGVLLLQEVINGSSSFFYAGLLAGGTLTSGQIFTYVPSTANSPFRSNLLSIKSNWNRVHRLDSFGWGGVSNYPLTPTIFHWLWQNLREQHSLGFLRIQSRQLDGPSPW